MVTKASGQTQGCSWLCVVTEKQKLKNTDYPLIARILQGPCEQVSKVFLMEKDQVEEVTYDVSPLLSRRTVLRRVGVCLVYLQLG